MSMNSFHGRTSRPDPARTPAPRAAPPSTAEARQALGVLRADAALVARGLATSRSMAQKLINAGRICWQRGTEWLPVTKSSQELPVSAELQVAAGDEDRYVSRGGLKLAGALAHTGLAPADRYCLDVGQSTGGFTDCLLQAGARRVSGVDVGHGQLNPRLAADPRVACHEGVNARHLEAATLGGDLPPAGFDLIVADLSFISLSLVLPRLVPLLAAGGDMLLLVKPQFELGPQAVGKGGIVRDETLYREVEARYRSLAAQCRLTVRDWFDSPITGGDGNREFFLWICHE